MKRIVQYGETWVRHSELYNFSALRGFPDEIAGDINKIKLMLHNEMSQYSEHLNKLVNQYFPSDQWIMLQNIY